MRKYYLTLSFALLLVCCAEKIIEKPDDLIPQEKMVSLLYDQALLNAAKSTNKAILEEYFDSPSQFLFKQYGIDSAQFSRSDLYYTSQPLAYEAIYKEVAARLEKEKLRLDEVRKKINDSLAARSRQIKDSL